MEDLTQKCRLCLKVAHDTVNLFRECKGVVYSDIILNFLEIEVQDTPNWPSNACPDCIEFLDNITNFQTQIVSSHKALYAEIYNRKGKRALEVSEVGTEEMPKRIITSADIETHETKPRTTESPSDKHVQSLSSKRQVIQDIRSRSVVRSTSEASPEELQLEVLMNEMRIFTCHLCQTDAVNFYTLRTHVRSRHCLRDYQICCDQSILISPSQLYEHFRMHLDDKVPLHGDHLEQMLEVSSPTSEDIPETVDVEGVNPKTEPNESVPIQADSEDEEKSGHPHESHFDHPSTDEASSDLFESESEDELDFTPQGPSPDPTPLQQPSQPKNWTQLRKGKPSGPRIKGRTWSSVVKRRYNPTPEEEKLEATMNEMKIFVCRICETDTGTMFQLREHVKQDHSQAKYEVCCNLKISVSPAFLYEHIRLHLDKEAFQCKECGKNFKTSLVLQVHQVQMHSKGEPTNICEVCGKGSYTAKQHQTHMMQHMDKQFKCPTCGKEYTYKPLLEAHIKKIHQLQNDFLCDICGKGFPTNGNLLSHIADHAGPHGGNRKKKTKPKAHPSHFGDEYFQ